MLECWSAGVLECWSAGVLEVRRCWGAGVRRASLGTSALQHASTPAPAIICAMKTDRRSFLRISGAAGVAAAALGSNSIELVAQASRALGNRTPGRCGGRRELLARHPERVHARPFADQPQQRQQLPSPTVVHEAYKRYLDYSNQAPVYHRGLIERNIEVVRRRLAAEFGCDAEEMAITRNSSESLQIAQNGLDLEAGRRSADHRAGLRPHADDVGSAGAARQDQDHQGQLPGAEHRRERCSACSKAPSRRAPRCCTSATSRT